MAIDIGGTFTDLVAYRTDSGDLTFTKAPTTPRELTDAIVACIEKVALPIGDIELFIHGSTVGINTIIERKGSPTALITTRGFRDVYEMGRRNRPEIYDLLFHRPRPLVPRDRRYEVTERMNAAGEALTALVDDDVVALVREISSRGIGAIAVCTLHSYANPAHEERIGELLRQSLPEVPVSLSSEIHREYREYERTSTTVINAYLTPVVGGYLNRLETRLRGLSFTGRTLIMQSSGGVMTLNAAARQPVRIIESGPAGGVAGTLWLCEMLGYKNAIAFDMGGTTAKACVIEGGQAKVTTDYYVGGRVSGHPVQVPFLDIIEIGAGGGSIANIDPSGGLRIGPQSAGADPGPACYGIGGVEPTVTDANLLVGKLDADHFLGGEMPLDRDRAAQAVGDLGARLGLTAMETANGILRIANAMMARAVSKVSVQRGYDPRDFVMVAYGGAGPMHATAVARELGVRNVVIPQAPAEFSALGMLTTDVRYDSAQTYPVTTTTVTPHEIDRRYLDLEEVARGHLLKDINATDVSFVRTADMRYVGQFHTLTVQLPNGPYDDGYIARLNARFTQAHEAAYGHADARLPTELISLRLASFVRLSKPPFTKLLTGDASPPKNAFLPDRRVTWEDGSETSCIVVQKELLLAGNVVAGPAIVQEYASVIPIGRGESAQLDEFGNLHITMGGGEQ